MCNGVRPENARWICRGTNFPAILRSPLAAVCPDVLQLYLMEGFARFSGTVYRIAKGIPGNCLMYKKLRQGTHAMVHRYTASPMVYPITLSGITSCIQASTWKYTSIPFFGLTDARYTCNSFFLKGLFCKVYLIFYLVGKWMK